MSDPTSFTRQTSFALYSAENPGEPHSGADLDVEFNAAKLALDETQAALADIRRSDGTLAEGIVGLAQLDASVSLGVTSKGVWATGTLYTANVHTVFNTTKLYRCAVTHTAGVFATDLAAGKWVLLADFGVQVLDTNTVNEQHLVNEAVTAAKIRNAAVTTDKLASLSVTNAKLALLSVTLATLATEVTNRMVPAGIVASYAGGAEPAGWLFCYGQVVSQATYPALYAALSTTYNTGGEGAGNFRLPDYRGRIPVPRNDMGGVAGSAIDDAAFGGSVSSYGAIGGAKNTTLTQANLPAVTWPDTLGVSITDPGHLHAGLSGWGSASDIVEGAGVGLFSGAGGASPSTVSASTGITAAKTGSVTSGGSGTAISRMPPGLIQNFIIKAH